MSSPSTQEISPKPKPEPKPSQDFGTIVSKSFQRAVPSGVAGGVAMGLNVLCLMWLRTTVNYQYKYGTSTGTALRTLYNDGGVLRFYRGLLPALVQGPMSRFGDTAANTGVLTLLDSYEETAGLPTAVKTGFCSIAAASWRLFLMPIDTLKTSLQADGSRGFALLKDKFKQGGPSVLYNGGLGAVGANMVGYYPWFYTYNQMDEILPKHDKDGEELKGVAKLGRRAAQGFCASVVSDVCSNSIRVIKVYKQTNAKANISYLQCANEVIATDGLWGLFGRGLGTKIISNGMQGAMFSVLWKTIEPLLFQK